MFVSVLHNVLISVSSIIEMTLTLNCCLLFCGKQLNTWRFTHVGTLNVRLKISTIEYEYVLYVAG